MDDNKKFNATQYKNDFNKEKYDRIPLTVPKGEKAILTEKSKQLGYKSLNSFIIDAIKEKLEK